MGGRIALAARGSIAIRWRRNGPSSTRKIHWSKMTERGSAVAGQDDTRSLRRARRPEGVHDRELWQPRARVRETAHAAAASFRRVAPVWHVRGAFAELESEVIEVSRRNVPASAD